MARLGKMLIALAVSLLALTLAAAQQCGSQGGGATCPGSSDPCCSQFGFCGHTNDYCGTGCQSGCTPPGDLLDSTGKASHYSTYVPSACYGNDTKPFPKNRYMARVSDNLWKHGQACGKYYEVRCQGKGCRNGNAPGNAIKVKVIDYCLKGCEGRVFDLSEEAFGAIADKNARVINVEYAPEKGDESPWDQENLTTEVGRIRK